MKYLKLIFVLLMFLAACTESGKTFETYEEALNYASEDLGISTKDFFDTIHIDNEYFAFFVDSSALGVANIHKKADNQFIVHDYGAKFDIGGVRAASSEISTLSGSTYSYVFGPYTTEKEFIEIEQQLNAIELRINKDLSVFYGIKDTDNPID